MYQSNPEDTDDNAVFDVHPDANSDSKLKPEKDNLEDNAVNTNDITNDSNTTQG